jgi:hypothetical protein
MLAGQPENPGAGHLFVARSDMEWFGRNPVGSIKRSVSPLCGDHHSGRARSELRPSRFSPRLSHATDLTVAQAVVDENEKFARRRHAADLSAPTFAHLGVMASDGRLGALVGHRLEGGPTHGARAFFGDVAPADRDVGFFVGGGEPSPAAQMRAEMNLEMSPISATNIAARTGPAPGMARTAL